MMTLRSRYIRDPDSTFSAVWDMVSVVFLLYVCLSLLLRWRGELQGMELQGVILFLQKLPTQGWDEGDLEVLLSTAFMWQSVFDETIKGGARAQTPGAPYQPPPPAG